MTLRHWVTRHPVLVSNTALALVLLVGAAYLTVGALRIDPLSDDYRVTVRLHGSGGVQANGDVSVRGQRIGRVAAVDITVDGVEAQLDISAGHRVPADGTVVVAALSAAGEQYIDFRPDSDDAPYLADGDVVEQDRTDTPVPFATMLVSVTDLVSQIDPAQLSSIIDELDAATAGGPAELQAIIDGGGALLTGLDSVLPETITLIRTGRTLLQTVGDIEPDLTRLSIGGTALAEQLSASDAEIRALLDDTPARLDSAKAVIGENRDAGGDLLKNLARIARAARLHTPAIAALFPAMSAGAGAFGLAGHDNQLNVVADPYPRPTCDYLNPTVSPSIAAMTPPLKYMYCNSIDPGLQVRGAQNVPRPPGDDTGGPPAGATGQERTGG
ncbi:MCE family protein [Rhodococcus sp. 15-2388-1-1a]|uniref:MlaD family protein n=1 Tax=Nocardiaceae TaxID=85025 RepID=UPI00055C71E4|nr:MULTISPECIES: MCE family protein [Rhodococcus]OZF04289.1 MCE family protein [Rhodococcus sp. 15-2388-1-1a]